MKYRGSVDFVPTEDTILGLINSTGMTELDTFTFAHDTKTILLCKAAGLHLDIALYEELKASLSFAGMDIGTGTAPAAPSSVYTFKGESIVLTGLGTDLDVGSIAIEVTQDLTEKHAMAGAVAITKKRNPRAIAEGYQHATLTIKTLAKSDVPADISADSLACIAAATIVLTDNTPVTPRTMTITMGLSLASGQDLSGEVTNLIDHGVKFTVAGLTAVVA